ncbi:uncharacterized protein [Miscanthus floridulus]|uniref:uncharacterized protein n=1 Tax=Miscanthus floridulus TaxID=154761 RepID=UPI0034576822
MAGQRHRSGAVDMASWCALLALVMVIGSLAGLGDEEEQYWYNRGGSVVVRGAQPCDELYVVAEGETLHSISARCGDPYILEHNPHVHDPDDVFPGLVIEITPRAGNSNSGDGRRQQVKRRPMERDAPMRQVGHGRERSRCVPVVSSVLYILHVKKGSTYEQK